MTVETDVVEREMPKYRSHKEVHALKIKKVISLPEESEGGAEIVPEDKGYASFPVSKHYFDKHQPEAGGYFVVYPDGYQSWSPKEAFEQGYTRIS